jgi:hypothetical protein
MVAYCDCGVRQEPPARLQEESDQMPSVGTPFPAQIVQDLLGSLALLLSQLLPSQPAQGEEAL